MQREHAEKLNPGDTIAVEVETNADNPVVSTLTGIVVRHQKTGIRIRVEGVVSWDDLSGLMMCDAADVPKSILNS